MVWQLPLRCGGEWMAVQASGVRERRASELGEEDGHTLEVLRAHSACWRNRGFSI